MGQGITHTHNEEEHQEIIQDIVSLETLADDFYIKRHNGDLELNKYIIGIRDRVKELKVKARMHIKNTKGVDELADIGAHVKATNEKLLKRAIDVLVGIIGSAAMFLLGKYLL